MRSDNDADTHPSINAIFINNISLVSSHRPYNFSRRSLLHERPLNFRSAWANELISPRSNRGLFARSPTDSKNGERKSSSDREKYTGRAQEKTHV